MFTNPRTMAARSGAGRPGCWPQPFRQPGAAVQLGPLSLAETLDRRQQCCPFLQQLSPQSELAVWRGMPHRNGASSANGSTPAAIARHVRAAFFEIEMAGGSLTGFGLTEGGASRWPRFAPKRPARRRRAERRGMETSPLRRALLPCHPSRIPPSDRFPKLHTRGLR